MRFKEWLNESYKNLFDKKEMERYKHQVYELLVKSYKIIGGINIQSPEELVDESDMWKLHFKDNELMTAHIYKEKNGRKLIAIGSNGSKEAKDILKKDMKHDLERSYLEASGPLEKLILKLIEDDDSKKIPSSELTNLTGKRPLKTHDDKYHYDRLIGGIKQTKALYGTPHKTITKIN